MALLTKKLLAIDWDAKNLRLVLVRPRVDGIDLLKAVSIPVPADVKMDDAESLGAFLREAMRQARISVKQALMSIPRDQVVLNTLALPPTPLEEMPAVVQFQIVKELPFSADQATLDFAVAGEFDPRESCNVLVAAVRNEQLDFYRQAASEAGLAVARVGLRPFANLTAVTARASDLKDKTLLLVEVGPQLTEIDIIRNGTLVFSRAASVALPQYGSLASDRLDDSRISTTPIRDHEPDDAGRRSVGSLMVDIIRSYEAHRATDPSLSVDRVVVCGASGIEAQLAEALAGRFATQADLYSPERALDLASQRAKELRGFSAALGLAIGHAQKGIGTFDFLHPKRSVSKRTVRLRKMPVAVATALLFAGSGVAAYVKAILPLKQQVAVIEARIDPKREDARDVEQFKAQVEALADWQKSEQHWPEVLVTLAEMFPPAEEAMVTRLDLETRSKGKEKYRVSRMTARLRTASLGKVNEISARLREFGFEDVTAGKETPIGVRRTAGVYRFDTSVEAQLPLRTPPKAPQAGAAKEAGETGKSPESAFEKRPSDQSRDREGAAVEIERGPLPRGRGSETASQAPAEPSPAVPTSQPIAPDGEPDAAADGSPDIVAPGEPTAHPRTEEGRR